MSLQWRKTLMHIGLGTLYGNELRVLVQPNAIELSLVERDFMRGVKAKIIKQKRIQSASLNQTQALSAEALQLLSNMLTQPDWRDAVATVALSNHFARYVVLPWNAEIKNKQEREAYLHHIFALHYGEQSKAWSLTMHQPSFGQATIASGIEHSLLRQLQDMFAGVQVPLKAIHPALMLAANQAMMRVKKLVMPLSFWLIDLEKDYLTLALVVNCDWKRVWNMLAEVDINAQILTLIQREVVLEASLAKLPILQHGDGEHLSFARVIHLSAPQQNGAAHKLQPEWATR